MCGAKWVISEAQRSTKILIGLVGVSSSSLRGGTLVLCTIVMLSFKHRAILLLLWQLNTTMSRKGMYSRMLQSCQLALWVVHFFWFDKYLLALILAVLALVPCCYDIFIFKIFFVLFSVPFGIRKIMRGNQHAPTSTKKALCWRWIFFTGGSI